MAFQPWNVGDIVNNSGEINKNSINTTLLGNGGYVVTWRDGNTIKFQIYDGNGNKVGTAPLSVDATTSGDQLEADVQAVGTDGGFVVTWVRKVADQNDEIYARKFSAIGTPEGGAYQVTNTTTLKESNPAMTGRDGGWASVHLNDGGGVTLVRYNIDGTKAGADLIVAPNNSGAATKPDVTWLGGDRYVVTYLSNADNRIHFKLVDGTTVSTAQGDAGLGKHSDVVALKDALGNLDGRFVVITDDNTSATAQVYTSSGATWTAVGDSISIFANGRNTNDAKVTGVTALKDGAFAVAYIATNGPDNGDLYVTVVKNGTRVTSPVLNVGNVGDVGGGTSIGDQYNPVITELADGRLAISWEDHTYTKPHVMTRIFDPRGAAVNVNGSTVADIYHGTEFADTFYGNAGNDVLNGHDGNDYLHGGAGADTLNGGNGTLDKVSYQNGGAVTASLRNPASNRGDADGDVYNGIEGIDGSDESDTLEGNDVANVIWGAGGNDLIMGWGGADELSGADGSDTIYGGAGADAISGGDRAGDWDTVTYEFSAGGVVIDLIDPSKNRGEAEGDSYSGIEAFIGSQGHDVIRGYADKVNSFLGKDGNDLLVGGSEADSLSGDAGDDTLQGGLGGDILEGGIGFDFVSYGGANAGISADLDAPSNNTGEAQGDVYKEVGGSKIEGLIGSDWNDILSGNGDRNELRGGGGADELHGRDGSDTLQGGLGADKLFGGDGNDYASYADSSVGVTVVLPAGGTGAVGEDTFDSIEGLIGSNHNDMLIGNAFSNHLVGGGGSDTLVGGFGTNTLEGGAGSDVYYASSGDVIIEHAAQGTDTVVVTSTFSLAGGSFAFIENIIVQTEAGVTLTGNDQDNTLNGNAGGDTLNGQGGNDILYGQGGGDGLNGGEGNDVLYGQDGSDALSGENGDDILDGGTGADAMNGGAGNDTFYVDNAGDIANGGSGTDTVYTSVNFTMAADMENLFATGGSALILKGSTIANTITGNAGANKIYGGLGNDVLTGGLGKDIFVFDTKLNKSTNVDRIMDFNVRDDSFHLDNKYFTKLGSGTASKPKKFNSDMFVLNNKAKDREDRIVYDKKTGALYYDQDGTGSKAQVKIATLTKNLKLTYSDFFVI